MTLSSSTWKKLKLYPFHVPVCYICKAELNVVVLTDINTEWNDIRYMEFLTVLSASYKLTIPTLIFIFIHFTEYYYGELLDR